MEWWWNRPPVLRIVIVNQQHDAQEAIRGALWGYRGPWLVLRDASLLRAHSEPQPLDGEVLVLRANVSFLQVL
jgi:hypothetical protein